MSQREIDELYEDLRQRAKRLLEREPIDKIDADFARAKAHYNAGNVRGGVALKDDVLSRLRDYIAEIDDVLCGLNVLFEHSAAEAFVRQTRAACIGLKAESAQLLTTLEDQWQTNAWAYWRELQRE
jgi:hypothetical protein